jgi:hypothetical protein
VVISIEGIWKKIDMVERDITIHIVFPVIIKNITSSIDYAIILSRLAEVTWDSSYRKHIVNCIKNNSDNKSRFCCILSVLGLFKLREKYCKGDC